MTHSLDESSRTPFAGTAWHYARYRPGYPDVFFTDLVARFHLDGTGRLLDLGCGTGQLTLRLAAHVAAAIGIDPEPEMLTEAAGRAQAAHITNVTWARGSSADLPGELGRFDLVTMGRSFHWMDREHVLTALDGMVDDHGGLVIANDSCLVRSATTWQQAIEDVQQRFLPPDWQASVPDLPDGGESHQAILARSAFRQVQQRAYQFTRTWTIEQAIGYLYSTSMPLRRLLGDSRSAFEQEVTDTLLAIDPAGQFTEPVTLEVLTATKQ
ncbi:class I SAM-dependent methyltransferase [Nocardia bovistercoris]|uniref:Class I SAM-dependent methyltransferase n=1 Tax=Nocardia bovistercoris TaxID=2785916 RepID=A0A931ICV2_9NOCA|nr:class I SAM-dependent methyltransferase [Nocardia bovistercoris]